MKNHLYPDHRLQFKSKYINQTGFSLVELMIAMVIGLFLMAGILGIVMSLQGSFKTQDNLSKVQDSARFVMTTLDNTVHLTGYYVFVDPTTTTINTAFPVPGVLNGDGTSFVTGQSIVGTTGAPNDTISVRVQTAPNDGLVNCQGDTNTTGANITWTNSYAVNAANQLTCAVSINGAAFSAPTVLIDNVASMKVLYGVDTDQNKYYDNVNKSIDTYLPAQSVTDWSKVLSVKITIQFLDLVNSKPGAPVNLPYSVLHVVSIMNRT